MKWRKKTVILHSPSILKHILGVQNHTGTLPTKTWFIKKKPSSSFISRFRFEALRHHCDLKKVVGLTSKIQLWTVRSWWSWLVFSKWVDTLYQARVDFKSTLNCFSKILKLKLTLPKKSKSDKFSISLEQNMYLLTQHWKLVMVGQWKRGR